MFHPLKNIATLQFGMYHKPSITGDVIYIQNTNFSSEPSIAFLFKDTIPSNQLLQENDILITAKGSRNSASLYSKKMGAAVASSLFFILRLNNQQVNPEYLTMYLNDSKTQNMLRKLSGATTVPTLNKKDLLELSVPIPGLHQQKQIVAMMKQWEEEKKLMESLLEKKDQFYTTLFHQLIQK